MAGVGAPWAGLGELTGKGEEGGRRGRGGAARGRNTGRGGLKEGGGGLLWREGHTGLLLCSVSYVSCVRERRHEGGRRGKRKGRKRKRKKGKSMQNFPNLKISKK
jgi:hypothetical protein